MKGAKEGCVSAENYHATCFNLDGENGFPAKFSPLGEISAWEIESFSLSLFFSSPPPCKVIVRLPILSSSSIPRGSNGIMERLAFGLIRNTIESKETDETSFMQTLTGYLTYVPWSPLPQIVFSPRLLLLFSRYPEPYESKKSENFRRQVRNACHGCNTLWIVITRYFPISQIRRHRDVI